jgi:predicted NBD/HSP70 family sugar kinase
MKILVIDIGGTNVKVLASGQKTPIKIPSGSRMTAQKMVKLVREATNKWRYEAVSIGYPGPVIANRAMREPHNLGVGWVHFDFHRAFGRPTQVMNDAAMQALGSYNKGRMLFLGLGTGLGSAMVFDGVVEAMELAHLPYKKGRTYEDYVGERGLERYGKKKWRKHVLDIVERLQAAFEVDDVVIGGGNSRLMKDLPKGVRVGNNDNAFVGGFRLWDKDRKDRNDRKDQKDRKVGR